MIRTKLRLRFLPAHVLSSKHGSMVKEGLRCVTDALSTNQANLWSREFSKTMMNHKKIFKKCDYGLCYS